MPLPQLIFFILFCSAKPNNNGALVDVLKTSDLIIRNADNLVNGFSTRKYNLPSYYNTEKTIKRHIPYSYTNQSTKKKTKKEKYHQMNYGHKSDIKKSIPIKLNSSKTHKVKSSPQIISINPHISEFPYFTPILNTSTFQHSKDECNSSAPKTGYFIPINVPPKRMLRVSTCNEETTVSTSLSVVSKENCLNTVPRKCRRWPGSIIEYIPQNTEGFTAVVRVGAPRVKGGQVRITIYTIPITNKNIKKLQKGKVFSGNSKKSLITKTKNNKKQVVQSKTTPKQSNSVKLKSNYPTITSITKIPKQTKSTNVVHEHSKTYSVIEQNINQIGGTFKVAIGSVISLSIIIVGFMIYSAFKGTYPLKR
ncbi:Uncharacterized protein QTN25_010548 [Entamoeba marina]